MMASVRAGGRERGRGEALSDDFSNSQSPDLPISRPPVLSNSRHPASSEMPSQDFDVIVSAALRATGGRMPEEPGSLLRPSPRPVTINGHPYPVTIKWIEFRR